MPVNKKQSAINAVRDQMSLDYASGKYLNNISNNLGLIRPKFGFTDDMWRAITKVLAVQEKQVKDKFGDVLEVLFGPRDTLGLTLSKDAAVGDKVIYLNSLENLPQIGTLILDEGLPTAETIDYILIDAYTNAVYLDSGLSFPHTAVSNDFSSFITIGAEIGATTVYLDDVSTFPATYLPASMVLSPSTLSEEVVTVTSINTTYNSVDLAAPTTKSHSAPSLTTINTLLAKDYVDNTNVLVLDDSSKFPQTGRLTLVSVVYDYDFVVSATSTTVTVPTPLVPDSFVGSSITFFNVTNPVLTGFTAYIVSNTIDTFTFSSTLPTVPTPGDEFAINTIVDYVANDYTTNVVTLKRNLPGGYYYAAAVTNVFLGKIESNALLSQAKVKRGCWDIMETTPRVVDILLCKELDESFDLRSSSYLHDSFSGTPSTTFDSGAIAGDTVITVTSNTMFNAFAEVELVGGAGIEQVSVYKDVLVGAVDVSTTTSTFIQLSTPVAVVVNALSGTYAFIGKNREYMVKIASNDSTWITPENPIPSYILSFMAVDNTISVYDPYSLYVAKSGGLTYAYSPGDTVGLYTIIEASNLLSGNMWGAIPNLFAGPYVYDYLEYAASPNTITDPYASLAVQLPGSVPLAVETTMGNTALEVTDSKYYESVDFPYNIILGDQTSQREQVTVQALNYKDSVETTLVSSTANTFTVTSLTGGTNGDFPIASGYRIIIDQGLPTAEVFYVSRVDVPTSTFYTVNSAAYSHSAGALVRLVCDVFTVSPLQNNHTGVVPLSQAMKVYPSITSTNISNSEYLATLADGIFLADTTGFPASGKVIINKGNGFLSRQTRLTADDNNSGTLSVADASVFPTTGTFKATVSKGSPNEEVLFISVVDTGLNTLTYLNNERKNHYTGDLVVLEASKEEIFEYSSISGNTLRFSSPTMLKSSHEIYETVIPSLGRSIPRKDGYDFPLRMPPSVEFRIRFVIDLIRAAGVRVNIKILTEPEILSLRR